MSKIKISMKSLTSAMNAKIPAGFCIACGKKHVGVEPDARNYVCNKCGEAKVFGAEEIMLMGLVNYN